MSVYQDKPRRGKWNKLRTTSLNKLHALLCNAEAVQLQLLDLRKFATAAPLLNFITAMSRTSTYLTSLSVQNLYLE